MDRNQWIINGDPLLTFGVGEGVSYNYWVNGDSDFLGISIDIEDEGYDILMKDWNVALAQIFHIISINHTKEVLEKFFQEHPSTDFEKILKEYQIPFTKTKGGE